MILKDLDKSLIEKRRLSRAGVWYVVTEIYRGAQLVWEAINSCFGSGAWFNDKPWSNTDGWKND